MRDETGSCDPGVVSSHSAARKPVRSAPSAHPQTRSPVDLPPVAAGGASDAGTAALVNSSDDAVEQPDVSGSGVDSVLRVGQAGGAVTDAQATGAKLTPDGIPRLTRRRDGSVVGGVAAGIADHLRVQVLWVRVAFALMAVFAGAGVLAYALLWI